MSNICQSCGMPLSKDPKGGGSELDGVRSVVYCSLCYENGEFYYKGDDVKEFQLIVVEEMCKKGWFRPLAWLLTRGIPKLSRWRRR